MKLTKLPQTSITKLGRIRERSRSNHASEFGWLMQHFSVANLTACFHELNGKKAVGVDGITKEEYAKDLDANIKSLVERMKGMKYRPLPVRIVHIPKANGGTRPLGIAALEDKIVQLMMNKVLEAIYEPMFIGSSYGFRPGKKCHDAIQKVQKFMYSRWTSHIVEIDFADFFGSIEHSKLLAILSLKIKDDKFIRYVARMLKGGISDKGQIRRNKCGTVQGSICSPILANIFAHYALDIWFQDVKDKHLRGEAEMARYCDDAVFLFSNASDASRFFESLQGRVDRFGLKLNMDKTKVLTMDKKKFARGIKQSSFDFLGFTFYLGRNDKNTVLPKLKSQSKRMRQKLKEIKVWLRNCLHREDMKLVWQSLMRKIKGYMNYFAISHNGSNVQTFMHLCVRMFFKFLNRRSQKKSITWEKFNLFMERFPLPKLVIKPLLFNTRRLS